MDSNIFKAHQGVAVHTETCSQFFTERFSDYLKEMWNLSYMHEHAGVSETSLQGVRFHLNMQKYYTIFVTSQRRRTLRDAGGKYVPKRFRNYEANI